MLFKLKVTLLLALSLSLSLSLSLGTCSDLQTLMKTLSPLSDFVFTQNPVNQVTLNTHTAVRTLHTWLRNDKLIQWLVLRLLASQLRFRLLRCSVHVASVRIKLCMQSNDCT